MFLLGDRLPHRCRVSWYFPRLNEGRRYAARFLLVSAEKESQQIDNRPFVTHCCLTFFRLAMASLKISNLTFSGLLSCFPLCPNCLFWRAEDVISVGLKALRPKKSLFPLSTLTCDLFEGRKGMNSEINQTLPTARGSKAGNEVKSNLSIHPTRTRQQQKTHFHTYTSSSSSSSPQHDDNA